MNMSMGCGNTTMEEASTPRAGWDEAAQELHEREEDVLLDEPTPTDFDDSEWVWESSLRPPARLSGRALHHG